MFNIEKLEEISNLTVYESFLKTKSKLQGYNNILVSLSGGSDSDIVLDLISKCKNDDENTNYNYVFFDTGLEYQATKEHLKFLEEKYKIKIL